MEMATSKSLEMFINQFYMDILEKKMNKKIAKISLCTMVITMFFTSNIVLALNDTGNYEQNTRSETKDSVGVGYLIDTEIFAVPNMLFHFAPIIDLVVGTSNTCGVFLAVNGISTVTLFMHFHKRVPIGFIGLDLLCTHIHVKVLDMIGNIVNQCNITDPSGFLFVNNWDGSTTLTRPLPSPGQFFYLIIIEVYGNYA